MSGKRFARAARNKRVSKPSEEWTMIAFLLLATGAQGAALPPAVAPEIVQARLAGDTWFVPVSIGGKTGDFVLATGVAKSSVDPDFATAGEGASLEPRIGSISLGPLRLISRKTFNAKGIIGADVLADRMVGFDFDTGQLALWPKGTKPLSARGWIEALPGAGTPRIQPIGLLETGVPTISMILGGEPVRRGDSPHGRRPRSSPNSRRRTSPTV